MAPVILEYSYTIVTILFIVIFLRKSLLGNISLKKGLLDWSLFGFLFNLYSLSWLYTTYPLPWIPSGGVQFLGITLLHVIASFVAGICYALVGFSFNKKINNKYKPLVFALLLSFAEILRSVFLSLLFSGNGGMVGLHWNASTIGNALSTTPFLEYAYFGGTYALTFVLGLLVYVCISKKHFESYWKYLLTICVGLIALHFFVPISAPKAPIKVGVVSTNFPTIDNKEALSKAFITQNQTVQTMTLSFSSSSPNIIVYPEDTRYVEYLSEDQKKNLSKTLEDVLLVDGDTLSFKNGFSNYSIFYEPKINKVVGRGKYLLFPFNEYIPTFFESIFRIFVRGISLDDYINNHTYTPQDFVGSYTYKDLKIGTVICSEIISFKIINSLWASNPNIVIYQSHLNVFHDNPWFVMQLRSFSKVAAAQLRTPFIGVSNGAPSYIISPYGYIQSTINTGFSSRTYTIYQDSVVLDK
ncbi:MAG: hypothetical protein WCT07_01355 [Candidatus Paceibacterota bacterium]|jgi:apolipoprotein N-acyltransferase